MFDRFREEGWTTDLALETRDVLIPEIVRTVALGWYSAVKEAYGLTKNRRDGAKKNAENAKNTKNTTTGKRK